MPRVLRCLLTAAGATVAALVVYGLLVVVLARLDAGADLELSGAWSVLSSVLYAVPFAAGAWAGVRAGLRALSPAGALLAGTGGAVAVFLAVTLSGGGTDLPSVVLPVAGAALGAWLALRAAGSAGRLSGLRRPDGRG